MFLPYRPYRQTIERFIRDSQELPLSYRSVGLLHSEGVGYDVDETVARIGRGQADLNRAKANLAAWKQFDIGWVELFPRTASLEPGTVVAVLFHHFGLWFLNGCRVVYSVGDRNHGARFGFAYGTLTNHVESGEELFEVFLNPDTDDVMFRIRAMSRPHAPLARLAYPIARLLQARFRRASARSTML